MFKKKLGSLTLLLATLVGGSLTVAAQSGGTFEIKPSVIASGGATDSADLVRAVTESGASAVAAGALFIYRGPHRAVLLSYPSAQQIHAHINDNVKND